MTTTPAGQTPPHLPIAGEWQPLRNAGDAPNPLFDKLIYGRTPSDWAIRAVLILVMSAALAVGTWSIYTLLTQKLGAPQPIAILGCGMFDIAALFFALLAQKYAVTTDSGLAPRLAMLAMVSTSAWVNWQHGQLEQWGTVGSVILAAAPVIAELSFEMFHRYAHRETLRRLGRVAQTLPVLGKWAWLAHPRRSRKTVDAHIRAALTEHEAVAEVRESLAGERARRTVSLPLPQVSIDQHTTAAVHLERVSAPALETAPAETGTGETPVSQPVSTPVETSETETQTGLRDRSPDPETGETKTETPVSPPRSPRETGQVTAIGDRETETNELLDLMKSRGGHMQVSLNDAMETTGRPKATAAKRLRAARDQYLAETA